MDIIEIHLIHLRDTLIVEMRQYINEQYFQSNVFDEEYYQRADDFIFRRDVTELSYSKVFKLAYTAIRGEDYEQYLLGLKIVAAKLNGNQRYTYFDRDEMKNFLI